MFPCMFHPKKDILFQNRIIHGCFQKIGVPQIIHFNRVFHYRPSILGYPYFWKHPHFLNIDFQGLSGGRTCIPQGSKICSIFNHGARALLPSVCVGVGLRFGSKGDSHNQAAHRSRVAGLRTTTLHVGNGGVTL